MEIEKYNSLKNKLIRCGYKSEIEYVINVLSNPCNNKKHFLLEYTWVVINSGMKNQIAEKIYKKILSAWDEKKSTDIVFGHYGKAKAIEFVKNNIDIIYIDYQKSKDKLAFLNNLPFIGPITKYHLARNLGFNFVKPDRHLVRISSNYNMSPIKLCKRISQSTGDKLGLVDIIIWRCGNLGLL